MILSILQTEEEHMASKTGRTRIDETALTRQMLHELGIPVHRIGYRQLCIAIPLAARDPSLHITKELYPYIASRFGYSNWHPVERAIRSAIYDAWNRRDTAIWNLYFPGYEKVPPNKLFILELAERINKTPLP